MLKCGAVFDKTGRHRYHLWRTWGEGPVVAFVMLNPSLADAERDDPTIRRCLGFAQAWGYGRLEVVNLFSWRAADPASLSRCARPNGPDNDACVTTAATRADLVVAGWGDRGRLFDRDLEVKALLIGVCRPMCLGVTRQGSPRHPLYAPGAVAPIAFELAAAT